MLNTQKITEQLIQFYFMTTSLISFYLVHVNFLKRLCLRVLFFHYWFQLDVVAIIR